MTDTNFRGSVNSMGSMEDLTVLPGDGPSYSYQGYVYPYIRGAAFNKDGIGQARVRAALLVPRIVVCDQIPSAATTTILAAATAVVSGTAITLTTIAPGNATAAVPSIAPAMPIIPFGGSSVVTPIALDFGFTTGTTTAGNSTIVVVDNTLFTVGQWLAVGGGGNSAKTSTLLTQVQSIVAGNTTGITVAPSPSGSLTNAPIGAANLFNQFLPPATQFGPGATVPTAASPHLAGGLFALLNPVECVCRNVAIAGITAAGGAFKIIGYDVQRQLMSETITSTAGTATVYGKKAFKYISSITPQFTDVTGTYSAGIGDTFGWSLRADRYESVEWKMGGINQINSTGFVAADLTSPALATTGDVRGTVQTSTKGAGTGFTAAAASNGVLRLWIAQSVPLWNNITGTPLNTVPLFGVNNSTT